MKYLERKLTESNKYTRYQVKKILYVIKTFSADTSKIIILGIIFHKQFAAYLVALTVLFLLRSYSGGIHNNTYIGCFLTSFTYFFLAIIVLPGIAVSFPTKVLLLTACIILCEWIGPVTSKYRPPLSPAKIAVCKSITITAIFTFIVIANIIPESPYVTVGFWVIILHTLQLILAKCIAVVKQKKKEKGGADEC